MPPRKFSQVECDAAQQMRDSARAELAEAYPRLRADAVNISVAAVDKTLDLKASITGDTAPYDPEEVRGYIGLMGVSLAESETTEA